MLFNNYMQSEVRFYNVQDMHMRPLDTSKLVSLILTLTSSKVFTTSKVGWFHFAVGGISVKSGAF